MTDKSAEDAERVRRMQALQMADLGTARREYISTSDIPNKLHRVTQAQVEASRASNIPGSESHRLAEANQPQLSAWNEAWKTIGGDIEMEELDSMMNGQTHRAQLTRLIMEKSGHKSKLMESLTAPSRGRKAVRAGLMQGRGDGMVGTRVRRPAVPAAKAPASKTKAKAASPIPLPRKPEPQRPTPVKSFKDPAKNCNNIPSSGSSKRGCPYLGKMRAAGVKTRRPIPAANNMNFETLLADSSTFLAAIPGMASGSSPEQAQKDTEKASNVETGNVNLPEHSSATGRTKKSEATLEVSKAEPKRPDIKIHVITSLSASGLNKATDSVTQKIDHGFGTCLPQPRLRNPSSEDSYNQSVTSLEARKRDKSSGSGKPNETELLADEMDLLDMNDEPKESELPVVKLPPAQPDAKKTSVVKEPEALPETKKPPVKVSDPAQELEKILQILACPSALTPFAVDYFEWRKTELMEEIISIGASATPVVQKEKGCFDVIDLGANNAAEQSSRAPAAPIQTEPVKEQEESTLISIESETESEYETAGGDADDEADDKSDNELIGGETDASSSGKGAFANNTRDIEDIIIEAEDSTVGPISSANWEQSNKSLIGESAVSREVKKTQLPKGGEEENLIGSRWLPGRTVNFDVHQPQTKKGVASKNPFSIKEDADALAAGAIERKEPRTTPNPVSTGPLVTVQAPVAPAQKLPAPTTSAIVPPARAIPEPTTPSPTLQAPTTKVEPPRRSRLPMREVPNFPISAATMQYFSSVATQGNSSTFDENTNPGSGSASPQIHARKTSGSSPLSPAAPTFRTNLASRPKANNIEISRKGTSGRQSSQHSQLSCPSPKANTQVSEQISKSIFVIEMEKRGIKVNFANYEERHLKKP